MKNKHQPAYDAFIVTCRNNNVTMYVFVKNVFTDLVNGGNFTEMNHVFFCQRKGELMKERLSSDWTVEFTVIWKKKKYKKNDFPIFLDN